MEMNSHIFNTFSQYCLQVFL